MKQRSQIDVVEYGDSKLMHVRYVQYMVDGDFSKTKVCCKHTPNDDATNAHSQRSAAALPLRVPA